MTNFLDRIKKAREAIGDAVEIASKEVSDQRLSICKACPSLTKPLDVCAECGCFMIAKTKLKNVACPLGKW